MVIQRIGVIHINIKSFAPEDVPRALAHSLGDVKSLELWLCVATNRGLLNQGDVLLLNPSYKQNLLSLLTFVSASKTSTNLK